MKELIVDESLETIVGGYNIDDLSPEDLAELQRLGGMLVDMQIAKQNDPASFDKDAYIALLDQLDALNKSYRVKYGS